jgi:two-component system, OmpR family, sensor kinase
VTTEDESVSTGWTVRQRLLALVVGLMALGLTLTGVVSFLYQYGALQDRIDAELVQEISEVAALAQQGPDNDGVPYEDAQALFLDFLRTAIAGDDEAFLGLVDGEVVWYSGGERPFAIQHPEVLAAIEQLEVPEGRAKIAPLRTQGTDLRLVVSDVRLPAETRQAYFVVAIDHGRLRSEVNTRLLNYVGISLASLVVAALLAHIVLGRLLRPLHQLREATAMISAEDLSRRVDIGRADTDIGELAVRFNQMLDRVEEGVRQQRQFLDDAAHELRTPLTIVRGNAELLRPEDPQDVATTRELLLDEVDRMQRLVDDLLTLARAQRLDLLQPTPTDLTEVAVESMERITTLGDRAWRLAANAEGNIRVDRHRLIQAVVQLAANAVKFSPVHSTVELATAWVEAGTDEAARAMAAGARAADRYVAISVSDQGSGIPEAQQGRIFERFGRGDNAEQVDGSGLGLAIVRVIAEIHGGAAGVESVVGIGSRFTIWLPEEGPDPVEAR